MIRILCNNNSYINAILSLLKDNSIQDYKVITDSIDFDTADCLYILTPEYHSNLLMIIGKIKSANANSKILFLLKRSNNNQILENVLKELGVIPYYILDINKNDGVDFISLVRKLIPSNSKTPHNKQKDSRNIQNKKQTETDKMIIEKTKNERKSTEEKSVSVPDIEIDEDFEDIQTKPQKEKKKNVKEIKKEKSERVEKIDSEEIESFEVAEKEDTKEFEDNKINEEPEIDSFEVKKPTEEEFEESKTPEAKPEKIEKPKIEKTTEKTKEEKDDEDMDLLYFPNNTSMQEFNLVYKDLYEKYKKIHGHYPNPTLYNLSKEEFISILINAVLTKTTIESHIKEEVPKTNSDFNFVPVVPSSNYTEAELEDALLIDFSDNDTDIEKADEKNNNDTIEEVLENNEEIESEDDIEDFMNKETSPSIAQQELIDNLSENIEYAYAEEEQKNATPIREDNGERKSSVLQTQENPFARFQKREVATTPIQTAEEVQNIETESAKTPEPEEMPRFTFNMGGENNEIPQSNPIREESESEDIPLFSFTMGNQNQANTEEEEIKPSGKKGFFGRFR